MRIVRERKQQCPAFANVEVREDEAARRLPVHGIREHVACCAHQVDGSENASAGFTVPASRAPDVGKEEGAGDESDAGDDSDDSDGAPQVVVDETPACSKSAEPQQNVPTASIAVDLVQDVKPVQMMRALQANIVGVQMQTAATVLFSLLWTRGA